MEKDVFLKQIKEWLEIDGEINENTVLNITSIETLAIIAFIDKKFNKQIDPQELKNISTILDLMKLIELRKD